MFVTHRIGRNRIWRPDVKSVNVPMMRRHGIARILLAALVCVPGAGVTAQDAAKGAALLAEARKAIGGEDRLRAVKALDVKGDFKRMAGQATIEGELQVRIELPDKMRRDEDLSPPGAGPAIVRTEVLNGATVWEENSGGGGFFVRRGRGGDAGPGARGGRAANIDPAQLEQAQRRARQTELARFVLAWLLAVDGPATWIATAEAPDGKADVLEVTPGGGPVVRVFLDQSSHLPLMLTWQGPAPQMVLAGRRGGRGQGGVATDPAAPRPAATQATLQVTLGDYKTVNGIRFPHLVTRGVNDMTIEEWTIDSYRINPSFRADVFTR
jgi:hypothetical protein